jgi:hypothetical protein
MNISNDDKRNNKVVELVWKIVLECWKYKMNLFAVSINMITWYDKRKMQYGYFSYSFPDLPTTLIDYNHIPGLNIDTEEEPA